MSAIEKINNFVEGRGLTEVLKDKSDKEKYAAITGRTYVTESTLEEDNAEWFVPGGLFTDGTVNEGNSETPTPTPTPEPTPEPTPDPEPTPEPTPEPEPEPTPEPTPDPEPTPTNDDNGQNGQNSEVDVESDDTTNP